MAIFASRYLSQLDEGFILTPERYNPLGSQVRPNHNNTCLREVAMLLDNQVRPKDQCQCRTVNTSDVREGYLKIPDQASEICSSKKRCQRGNVLISRLRPYLKQVGYCDLDVKDLAASTEFYVLGSKDGESIAFLVPFLLSNEVQEVLSNAVEGSQHPRFRAEILLNLKIPNSLLEHRKELSKKVEDALEQYRGFESSIVESIKEANEVLEDSK